MACYQTKALKREATLPVILNRSELKALFRAPKLLKRRIILTLIYSAGLRRGEAINLKTADIDFERKTIHIRQSKYLKDRMLPLSDLIARGLRKYLEAEKPNIYLFNGKEPDGRYSPEAIGWIMHDVIRRFGEDLLSKYLDHIKKAWNNRWVVYCEPSLCKPDHVMGYLGQYTHRVAITNHRIVEVGEHEVLFSLKDYSDHGKQKTTSLTGEEFLMRFCLHILPRGFVKIRHYGIYSSRFLGTIMKDKSKMVIQLVETTIERISRLIGVDITRCPCCRKGQLILVDVIPRSRSPAILGLISFSLQR